MSVSLDPQAHRYESQAALPLWKRIIRRGGKRYLAWKYRHFKPDSEPATDVKVAGLQLYVMRSVFNPALHFTSGVLAAYLKKPGVITKRDSVFDLGTGSGLLAVTAALAGARKVMATDLNPDAVRCARTNVKRYGLESVVSVEEGDMFSSSFGERFDLVLCNPPYFRGVPATMAERAFRAGPDLEWITRFAHELHDHISPSGSSVISLGDAADIPAIVTLLEENGWSCVEVGRRDLLVETIYLFSLTSQRAS